MTQHYTAEAWRPVGIPDEETLLRPLHERFGLQVRRYQAEFDPTRIHAGWRVDLTLTDGTETEGFGFTEKRAMICALDKIGR
jgi:hypothetical protein